MSGHVGKIADEMLLFQCSHGKDVITPPHVNNVVRVSTRPTPWRKPSSLDQERREMFLKLTAESFLFVVQISGSALQCR